MTRTRERLDRKTLKEDPLVNLVAQAGDWVAVNQKAVVGVLVGVVVLLVLGVLWVRDSRHRGVASDQSFSQVVLGYANGQYDQALQAAQNLQSQSPGSRGAVMAQYVAGMCQLQLGKFAEAEQSLRGYLQTATKAPFYESAARPALAAALEAQERHAEAAAMYQEAASGAPELQASQLKLQAARAFRAAGSVDQAKAILQTLATGEPNAVTGDAKLELAVLENLTTAVTPARP